MVDTTEATTIGEELKAAAARLRQVAAGATSGRWVCGDLEEQTDAGMQVAISTDAALIAEISLSAADAAWRYMRNGAVSDGQWIAHASPLLAEPLASWLESAAWVAGEHPQDPDYAGLPDTRFCTECYDEETTCVAFIDGALAVARVLNGSQP